MNNMRLVIGVQASFIPISSSHRGGLFQNGLYSHNICLNSACQRNCSRIWNPRIERGRSVHLDIIYAHLGGKHRAVAQH